MKFEFKLLSLLALATTACAISAPVSDLGVMGVASCGEVSRGTGGGGGDAAMLVAGGRWGL